MKTIPPLVVWIFLGSVAEGKPLVPKSGCLVGGLTYRYGLRMSWMLPGWKNGHADDEFCNNRCVQECPNGIPCLRCMEWQRRGHNNCNLGKQKHAMLEVLDKNDFSAWVPESCNDQTFLDKIVVKVPSCFKKGGYVGGQVITQTLGLGQAMNPLTCQKLCKEREKNGGCIQTNYKPTYTISGTVATILVECQFLTKTNGSPIKFDKNAKGSYGGPAKCGNKRTKWVAFTTVVR